MHTARFYLTLMLTAPIWIAAISRASKSRWAATIMMALYTATHLTFVWLLPLAPATPKLGPVYQNITHLVPPDFPLLLIPAAFVFDLVRQRIGNWSRWAQPAVLGAVFFASFIAMQWPFANFLMSPGAQNRFFVANNYPYFMPSTSIWVRSIFAHTESTPFRFWIVMFEALLVAVLMMRIGFSWGDWMRRIRR
jgi:hypothetical protein